MACGTNGAKKDSGAKKIGIEIPVPPAMMDTEEERAEFLAENYWRNFDFTDTAYVNKPEITEQVFVDYISILRYVPVPSAQKSVAKTMSAARADSSMYAYFAEISEKYLYDPNSPMRWEDLYIPVLENIIEWDGADDIAKLRPRAQLRMALKNRVGEQAADFAMNLSSGKKIRLHDIKSPYVLLFFNNPDCTGCAELTAALRESEIVQALENDGMLKVAAVYPDEDLTAWRNHLDLMPPHWTNAYDGAQTLRHQELYDLRAIPTLYLLDSEKRILIKDAADLMPIEAYFYNIYY